MTKNFQTIVFARKRSLVQKTGEAIVTTLVLLNNSVLIPGKVLHIGKVKLLSYKEYLSVVRFSQVGRELIICLTTLNIIIFTLILCLFYRLV